MTEPPMRSSARSAAPDPRETHRRRILRFGGAGVVSAATDFAVYALALGAGAQPAVANALAFLVANVQSYLLNARLTFVYDGRPAQISVSAYGRFLLTHALSLVVSTALVATLAPHIGPLSAKFIAIGVAAVWNYGASHYFVFGRDKALRSGVTAPAEPAASGTRAEDVLRRSPPAATGMKATAASARVLRRLRRLAPVSRPPGE